MDVFGTPNLEGVSTQFEVVRYDFEEKPRKVLDEVQLEHTLDVFINEVLTLRIVCTPKDLFDLVVGRLFTQGIISGVDDIEHPPRHGFHRGFCDLGRYGG